MTNKPGRLILFPALLLVVFGALPSAGADNPPDIEAGADRILRAMSDYLKSVDQFTFQADVAYDSVVVSGQKIQYGATGKISVRRPDHLRVEHHGDEQDLRVVFNGKMFTLHDVRAGFYAQKEMTADIDTAVDRMFERFGFSVPTADLVYADPYSLYYATSGSGYVVVSAPPSAVVYAVPTSTTVVYVGSAPYYYYGGTYYVATDKPADQPPPPESDDPEDDSVGEEMTADDHNYEVVAPPMGATVPYLPDEAAKKTVGGTTYMVHEGTYYRPFVSEGETIYMVVEAPHEKT